MRNIFIFVYTTVLLTKIAIAGTCTPGYFPRDGVCTICPMYYACPDGDNVIFCSESNPAQYTSAPGSTACINCPTTINDTNGFQYLTTFRGNYGAETSCRAEWIQARPHGSIRFSCCYSKSGYDTVSDNNKCMMDVIACDAGYVPIFNWIEASQAYRIWTNSYAAIPTEVCRPAGIGNYSADGDMIATTCPTGTSTHTDTAASADDCAPLCPGGATRFRIGQYAYNLWRDKTSTPSLNVRMPDGNICYVRMAPESGAINIQIDNAIFHVIN